MSAGIKTLAQISVGTTAVTAGGSQECTSLIFSADAGNANKVYIGDANVSPTRYSVALTAGQNYTYVAYDTKGPGFTQLNINKFYVYGGAAAQLVYVSYLERGG